MISKWLITEIPLWDVASIQLKDTNIVCMYLYIGICILSIYGMYTLKLACLSRFFL